MSARIKISYTDEKELYKVLELLYPLVYSWKTKETNGCYKRAYIELLHDLDKANK